jgi:hypothetical protein
MQQPRSGQIKKPHKHEELCGFFSSKPKLFATYIFILILSSEAVKQKKIKKPAKAIFRTDMGNRMVGSPSGGGYQNPIPRCHPSAIGLLAMMPIILSYRRVMIS